MEWLAVLVLYLCNICASSNREASKKIEIRKERKPLPIRLPSSESPAHQLCRNELAAASTVLDRSWLSDTVLF